MEAILKTLEVVDWKNAQQKLDQQGYAVVENVLSDEDCQEFMEGFENPERYRKNVDMERYRFGKGHYKYFKYPLPDTISKLREHVYPKLVPVANQWMHNLKLDINFPAEAIRTS